MPEETQRRAASVLAYMAGSCRGLGSALNTYIAVSCAHLSAGTRLCQDVVVHLLLTFFLFQVACAEGTLYTMTVPQLQVVFRVATFPHTPVSLMCSPDKQWVLVSAQDSDLGPKVSAQEPSSW